MFSNCKLAILMVVMEGFLLAEFFQSVNAGGGSHTQHSEQPKDVVMITETDQQKVSKTQENPKHASGSAGGGSNPSSPRGAAKREKSSEAQLPPTPKMDINADLPSDLEWYKDQIAGHHQSVIRNGVRQIGILKKHGHDEILLKLAQDGMRGEREIAFYEQIENIAKDENSIITKCNENEAVDAAMNINLLLEKDPTTKAQLIELHKFIPRFYGCRKIRLIEGDAPKTFLLLEDITYPFTKPCIMDIKIGRVTYDPFASVEKKTAQDAKYPWQNVFGFRISGYRVHTEAETSSRDRVWGQERTEENIQQAFEEYLIRARPDSALQIVNDFLHRLLQIRDWFQRQTALHFYASSILLVYEGHTKLPPKIDIRMIDFSHVFPSKTKERDENYLYGLDRIVGLFQKIHDDLKKTADRRGKRFLQ